MYYYIPEEYIEHERTDPHTCIRRPMPEHGLFLWNQAMFVLEQLLTAGLLHINELDPIRRYLPSYNRPRKGGRYSAFQVCKHLYTCYPHNEKYFMKFMLLISTTHLYFLNFYLISTFLHFILYKNF